MKRNVSMIVALMVALLALAPVVTAAVPNLMQYQGHLTDDSGAPLDTIIDMTFTIYDDSAGGTVWWNETQPSVVVTNGLFNVLLGSVNPISDSIFVDTPRWLGITIGSDPEISPRTRLVTVPYAYRVSTVDGASGGDIYGGVQIHSPLLVGDVEGEPGSIEVSNGWMSTVVVDGAGGTLRLGGGEETTPGKIEVTDGTEPIIIADGQTGQIGVGAIDEEAQFHVQTPDRPHAGSFKSGFPSSSAEVIRSEFVAPGEYNAAAIVGVSVPADGWGFGGRFQGGWTGVEGTVYSTGNSFYTGVFGYAWGGSGYNHGVYGYASGSGINYGVLGSVDDTSATVNYGVFGYTHSPSYGDGYAVYGYAPDVNYAGFFVGNVEVTDTLFAGLKLFKIDHPLDPENKYLIHACVESPDVMNVYSGNVTLDAKGEATVKLPDYFEALNRDFRYQLTCIGGFAPVYISQEISNNQFTIAGGELGMKISWQVTGIRKDPFAQANRIQVEVDKPAKERGKYLHPEAFGLGEEYGIHYELHKRIQEQLQEKSARKMEQR